MPFTNAVNVDINILTSLDPQLAKNVDTYGVCGLIGKIGDRKTITNIQKRKGKIMKPDVDFLQECRNCPDGNCTCDRNEDDDGWLNKRVLLIGTKSNGLAMKHCVWQPSWEKVYSALLGHEITGVICSVNKRAGTYNFKISIDEPFKSCFEYCELSFTDKDVVLLGEVDLLEDVDFNL